MQGLIAAGTNGDWSLGASILTFAFPMILFIAVASALYILYTKPHMVPGHRYQMAGRAATDTAPVRPPTRPGTESGQAGTAGGQVS